MPFGHKWYGVTEVAIADPDGRVITFAEPDKQNQSKEDFVER